MDEKLKEENIKLNFLLYKLAFKDVQSDCIIYGSIHYPFCKQSINRIRSYTDIPSDLYDCFLDDNNFLFKDMKYHSYSTHFGYKQHCKLLGYIDDEHQKFYKIY